MVDEIDKISKINFEDQDKFALIKKASGTKKRIILLASTVLGGLTIAVLLLLLIIYLLVRPVISKAKEFAYFGSQTYASLKDQNLALASENLKTTKEKLEKANNAFKKLSWLKYLPLVKNYYRDGEQAFAAAKNSIEAGEIITQAVVPYADVLGFKGKGSFTGGSLEERLVKIIDTLGLVYPQISEAIGKIEEAEKQLASIDPKRYPEKIRGVEVRNKISQAKVKFNESVDTIKAIRPILKVMPSLLGHPNERRYLVIFENDGELRPTGGFMTAYTVLRIKSGQIQADRSNDIYYLDDRNPYKEKNPPEAIKKYLLRSSSGISPYWYLRDMNFSPDFKESMAVFVSHYEKVPGEPEITGVIALDTKVLKDLVMLLGDVEIPGFGKFTLEPDKRCHNIPQIICELEYIVDTPIGGIKVDRKGILGPMMQSIMKKAMTSSTALWPRLFKIGLQDTKEKHVLFYFLDTEEQTAIEAFGAAGDIAQYEADYLHVNDSNFGGAKSNLFVTHEVEQEVNIDDQGRVTKTLTLTYSNPEPMDDCNLERKTGLCLNGVLRNYVRIYVPQGSKLTEMVGSEAETNAYDELGKTVFEGFFTLRGDGGRNKLVVKYQLPESLTFEKEYKLLIQKQPGTLGHKYSLVINGEKQELDLTTDIEISKEI